MARGTATAQNNDDEQTEVGGVSAATKKRLAKMGKSFNEGENFGS